MALSESNPESKVQHVPRWKQLGLKLKSGPESPQNFSFSNHSGPTIGSQTNGHAASTTELPQRKKRRVDVSTVAPSGADSKQTDQSRGHVNKKSDLKKSDLKKRVSFTADTKPPDGAPDDDITKEPSSSNQPERTSPSAKESKGRLKPAKQMKAKKLSQESPRKSADALDYLRLYRDDRATWKFNKNREIWILKHALSVKDIPTEYESALLDYIRGLQSSGARSRLKEQCLEAQATGDTPMTNESDQNDTEDSKEEPKSETDDQHSKSQRAEVLLQCLSEAVGQQDVPSTAPESKALSKVTARETNGLSISQPQKKKKKKNRTVVVEVSESSSSSGSSLEDSDDGQGMAL